MKISPPRLRVIDPAFIPIRAAKTEPVIITSTTPSTGILNVSQEQGRALWHELHVRAIEMEGQNDSAWIDEYTKRIPCGQCRQHWMAMVDGSEVDWNNYFQWTVDRHNEINAQLEKPLMSFTKESYLELHAR